MTVVKALVKSGITICATIHSPTPYCFNLFDTLMILLRGHVVYFGENGARARAPDQASHASETCRGVPLVYPCNTASKSPTHASH
jgi:ABC-type multidrug transport system ATPase subunit